MTRKKWKTMTLAERRVKIAELAPAALEYGAPDDDHEMGIDLPDGRALMLEPCEKDDALFLRLVVHRYNNFDKVLAALKRAVPNVDEVDPADAFYIRNLIAELEEVQP